MPRKISAKKRAALIRDLIHADLDLTTLHSKYGLSPDSLSQWVQDETNHRTLTGLCVLADIQTQLLLSRYRLIAAGNLIDMASNPHDGSKSGQDTARRACVDLLKLELPRADADVKFLTPTLKALPDNGLSSLHRLIQQDNTQRALPVNTDTHEDEQSDE